MKNKLRFLYVDETESMMMEYIINNIVFIFPHCVCVCACLHAFCMRLHVEARG